MQCDICGKELPLRRANIEGIELNVCSGCGKFGKVISKPADAQLPVYRPKIAKPKKEPVSQIIVKDYAIVVKKAREALDLKQEDFAKKINEKVSVIHNVESGRFEPPIELAKKLERFLKIKLVEEYKEEDEAKDKKGSKGLTIGDIINLE